MFTWRVCACDSLELTMAALGEQTLLVLAFMCNSGNSGSVVYELIRSVRVEVKVFVTLLFSE